jgi:hypothetical protein
MEKGPLYIELLDSATPEAVIPLCPAVISPQIPLPRIGFLSVTTEILILILIWQISLFSIIITNA